VFDEMVLARRKPWFTNRLAKIVRSIRIIGTLAKIGPLDESEMSSAAIPVHVALVDESGHVNATEDAEVAGALNEQVQADVAPAWKVAATVGEYCDNHARAFRASP